MATEVHQRAAAGLIDVPEPVGVRARVLLRLFDEVNAAEGPFIGHLFRLHVFRCEEQLLGVQQQHTGLLAGVEHCVRLLERDAKRFFTHHVFPGARRIDRHRRVQAIRGRDGHHLDRGILEHLAIVCIVRRNAVSRGECPRIPSRRRGHRHHLRLVRHHPHRRRDAVRLKSRADDSNLHL